MNSFLKKSALLGAMASMALASQAFAVTIFPVSTGVQPSDVGIITLTQVNPTTVNVLVDLKNSTYGFLNTGQKAPFAFTLSGTEDGLSAVFLQPAGGGAFGFALSTTNVVNSPFGSFGVQLTSTAGNGSGNAYYGDLSFNLIRASGLTEASFISNGLAYFSADLTDGQNTGSQGWSTPSTSVPDGGATVALLGLGLAALAVVRRKIAA